MLIIYSVGWIAWMLWRKANRRKMFVVLVCATFCILVAAQRSKSSWHKGIRSTFEQLSAEEEGNVCMLITKGAHAHFHIFTHCPHTHYTSSSHFTEYERIETRTNTHAIAPKYLYRPHTHSISICVPFAIF